MPQFATLYPRISPSSADKKKVRVPRFPLILMLLLALSTALPPAVHGSRIVFREQYYQLFRRHLYVTPARAAENIYWLEKALHSDFANPLHALARVRDEREWEWYRNLFTMHIHLLIVDQYLLWSSLFMPREALFYNAPWREQNLQSLDRAEELLRFALIHWEEAERWSQEAASMQFVHLERIQYWEDQHHRIRTGSLDYRRTIGRHLERVDVLRDAFLQMDPTAY